MQHQQSSSDEQNRASVHIGFEQAKLLLPGSLCTVNNNDALNFEAMSPKGPLPLLIQNNSVTAVERCLISNWLRCHHRLNQLLYTVTLSHPFLRQISKMLATSPSHQGIEGKCRATTVSA